MVFLDDLSLLFHLRSQKYCMNEVFQSFENIFTAKKKFARFLDIEVSSHEKFKKIISDKALLLLKNRDPKGRRIIIERPAKLNTEIYSETEYTSFKVFVTLMMMFRDEESQIAGVHVIVDFADIAIKHFYSVSTAIEMMKMLNHIKVARVAGIIVINLPPYARYILDAALVVASEKLKKRFIVLKDCKDLKKFFDLETLPKEYGGKCDLEESIEHFKTFFETHKDCVQNFIDFQVDWSKVPESELANDGAVENIGSFRRLEVD